MTGFTPGPWGFRFLADDLDFDFEVTRPEDELPVAGIYQWSLGVSEANARLIAAAPDYAGAAEAIVAAYRLNDCVGRSDDDALEISIRDLRALVAAHEKAVGQ